MSSYQAYNDKLFSRWASVYDGFELLLSPIRTEITAVIPVKDKVVLDIATGTGSLAIPLGEHASSVIGIDLSKDMLRVAKKKLNSDKVTFLEMDATQLTFDDNSFDIVTISLGLHDMPEDVRSATLIEVKRVLKQDGKLYILEHDNPKPRLLAYLSRKLINTFESKYFLGFLEVNLEDFLRDHGFKLENKRSYLFNHLQFLTLSII